MNAALLPQFEPLPDGARILIRPVVPDDVELERRFIADLSPQSRRFRFLDTMSVPSEKLLRQLTSVDPAREAALAAVDPLTQHFIGVARFSLDGHGVAEIAVAVVDYWQRHGVGSLLVRKLIAVARAHGIKRLFSVDSEDNRSMRHFARKLGFQCRTDPADTTQALYSLDLAAGDDHNATLVPDATPRPAS
jgi:RimJ/RimL family protein N-acetyltransferase